MNRRRFLYAGFSLALSIPLAVLATCPRRVSITASSILPW